MLGEPSSPQHRRLIEALAGEWRSEEHVAQHPGGPLDEPRRGRLVARPGLGGRFVISDYEQERDGVAVFAGHGMYGWDGSRYTMQWFDSDAVSGGDVVPGIWDGVILRFTRPGAGPRGRYEYEFRGGDSYVFRVLVGDEETGWAPVLVGLFRRVGAGD